MPGAWLAAQGCPRQTAISVGGNQPGRMAARAAQREGHRMRVWPGDTNGRARATVAVAELDYTGDTTRDAWCGYAVQHTIAAIVELVREIGVRRRDRYGCQPARCTGIAEGRSARDTKVRALGLHVTALFVEHD